MKRMNGERLWRPAVITAVLALAFTACGAPAVRPTTSATNAMPASATIFDITTSGFDRLVRSSQGLPTVVNIWASWCVPCRAEAPLLASAATRYAHRVRFIGIDTKDDRGSGQAFVRKFRLPYASAFDPKGDLAGHLKALGVPTTLFYAKDGALLFVHNGEIKEPELQNKLKQIL